MLMNVIKHNSLEFWNLCMQCIYYIDAYFATDFFDGPAFLWSSAAQTIPAMTPLQDKTLYMIMLVLYLA